ncbi:MAG: hypothetical protein CMJ46_02725 [Planctomyces sp.]|nr:hypothetical protein [Planctomyces sp.]
MEPLACLKCGGPLSDDDVNTAAGIAKCSYCDAWMHLEDFKKLPEPPPRERHRKELPVPPNMRIEQSADHLAITVDPVEGDSFDGCAEMIGMVVAVLVVMFLIVIILGSIAPLLAFVAVLIAIFIIVAAVTGASADASARREPRALRIVRGKHLRCRSPGYGDTPETVPLSLVKQFYSTEERDEEYNHSNKAYRSRRYYNVHVLLNDDTSHKVMTGLKTRQEALVVEGKIERFLELPDLPVAGEVE